MMILLTVIGLITSPILLCIAVFAAFYFFWKKADDGSLFEFFKGYPEGVYTAACGLLVGAFIACMILSFAQFNFSAFISLWSWTALRVWIALSLIFGFACQEKNLVAYP